MQVITPENMTKLRRDYPEAVVKVPYIEEAGQGWTFVIGAPVPDPNQRLQVRPTAKVAPSREVSAYEMAYRRGHRVPPIIVTSDWWVLDGNTRVAAAIKAGLKTLDYFRLDYAYEGASPAIIASMLTLAARLNKIHGKRMTDQSMETLILFVHQQGPEKTPRELAAELDCSQSTVSSVLAQERGRARVSALGFDPDAFSSSHLKRIGGGLERVNNQVVQPLLELVLKAGFTVQELGEITKLLDGLHTDEEKLAHLEAEARANVNRTNGLTNRPNLAGQIRRGLGFLAKAQVNPSAGVELSEDAGRHHLEVLEGSERIIRELIVEQRENLAKLKKTNSEVVPPPVFRFSK
jgi:hypothetical protein